MARPRGAVTALCPKGKQWGTQPGLPGARRRGWDGGHASGALGYEMCCRGEPAARLPALPLLPLPGAACTRAGGQGQARWRRPCCSQGQPLFCGVDQFIPRGPPHPAGALAGGVCRVTYITCVSCRLAPGCVLRVLGIKFCAAGRQRRGLPAPRLYRPRPPPFCTKIP